MTNRNIRPEDHLRLAYWCANRFKSTYLEIDDRIQIAVIGLIQASLKFDPNRNTTFATYARTAIFHELMAAHKRISKDHHRRTKISFEDFISSYSRRSSHPRKGIVDEVMHLIQKSLTPQESQIIMRRFGIADRDDESLVNIAADLNLSHETVRRTEHRALTNLARCLAA